MSRIRCPAVAFAVIAAVTGSAFVFVLPAFGGYDESLHFLRSWQVSDGGVFAREVVRPDGARELGGHVPAALVDDIRTLFREGPLAPGDAGGAYRHLDDDAPGGRREFVDFAGAAIYSPVPYLPTASAIVAGRALGLSTLALLLVGRLAGLAAFVALVALAIRRLPGRRWVLAIGALAPVAVFQAATVSADTLTLALAVLVVADALHLAASPRGRVPGAVVAEAVLATAALALVKQPYLLLAGLLLVPMWQHRGRVAAVLGAGLGAAAALALAWSTWARDRYIAQEFLPEYEGTFAYRYVDPDAQLEHLRDQPLEFAGVLARTARKWGTEISHDLFAQVGWWRPPWALVAVSIALVTAVVLIDADRLPGGGRLHALGGGLAALTALAVFVLAYAGWNAVGAPRIDAFQGRYLTPVLLAALVVALPRVPSASPAHTDRAALAVAGTSVVVLLAVVAGLARHFYL